MATINKIKLYQYRNYDEYANTFHPRFNSILGRNGVGKTNLLDSLHYACFGKSYFAGSDRNIVKNGRDAFSVIADIDQNNIAHKVLVKVKVSKSKAIEVNGKTYNKLSEHVGRFPIVSISPLDTQLLNEGSEDRRKLLDVVLLQSDKKYLQSLSDYNRIIKQRNGYLKICREKSFCDINLLQTYNTKLESPAAYIYEKRKVMMESFVPKVAEIYQSITKSEEKCEIVFKSMLEDSSMKELLDKHLEKDKILARTTAGIHKDDLKLFVNNIALKPYASQGQQKSVLLALKLAQYSLLKQSKGYKPILLLDDLFDKLDEYRVKHLLLLLHGDEYGQVFLTDTSRSEIPNYLKKMEIDSQTIMIEQSV